MTKKINYSYTNATWTTTPWNTWTTRTPTVIFNVFNVLSCIYNDPIVCENSISPLQTRWNLAEFQVLIFRVHPKFGAIKVRIEYIAVDSRACSNMGYPSHTQFILKSREISFILDVYLSYPIILICCTRFEFKTSFEGTSQLTEINRINKWKNNYISGFIWGCNYLSMH